MIFSSLLVSLQGVGPLQEVQVPIIDSKTCQDMYLTNPSENVDIRADMMCAGFPEGGKDSCQVRSIERWCVKCNCTLFVHCSCS